MTENDKKRFNEIFHSDKYFKNISDIDMMRTTAECDRLREYIKEELPEATILQYMHFAYWLGIYSVQKRPLTKEEVATKILKWGNANDRRTT